MSIKSNIESIHQRMRNAEQEVQRKPNSVELLVVSKFQSIQDINDVIQCNNFLFGENRVQEARDKFSDIKKNNEDVKLHLIGSLQRNKVKHIIEIASCIESVDRIELVHELGKETTKQQKNVDILFEYHTAEDSKAGFKTMDELFYSIDSLENYPYLHCKGLMTMAPFTDNEILIRKSFSKLRNLQVTCTSKYPTLDFSCLSMGMSQDFELAIKEGSTRVRIGSAIFKKVE